MQVDKSAVQMLYSRVETILQYVKAVQNGLSNFIKSY